MDNHGVKNIDIYSDVKETNKKTADQFEIASLNRFQNISLAGTAKSTEFLIGRKEGNLPLNKSRSSLGLSGIADTTPPPSPSKTIEKTRNSDVALYTTSSVVSLTSENIRLVDIDSSNKSSNQSNLNTFWRNSGRRVPGRPSLSANTNLGLAGLSPIVGVVGSEKQREGGMMSSFRDYQNSVSDAWDTGDDEYCIISRNAKEGAHGEDTGAMATSAEDRLKEKQQSAASLHKVILQHHHHSHHHRHFIGDSNISKQMSETAAMNVIEMHRNTTSGKNIKQMALTNNNYNNINNNNKKHNFTNNNTCTNDTILQNINNNCSSMNADSVEENSQTESIMETQHPTPRNAGENSFKSTTSSVINNCKQHYEAKDFKPRVRQLPALPGRPQLQRITSNSAQDAEYETKIEKFQVLFDSHLLDLVALKKLSWSGVPKKMRAISWRLLSKYLPPSGERRNAVLESKRQSYQDLRQNYFKVDSQDETQQDTYRQIHIDVPRMNPQIALFQQKIVQELFERILFIWSIRHPASGYVQGINDLVTPFFIVFLQEVLEPGTDIEKFDMSSLAVETRNAIEADSFWCLSKFLDCIQDNYIFAQLGIQEKVNQLRDLIQRIDGTLHRHLQAHGVDYLQFSFRWMNNLLTRELPLHCTIRLWDTYLAESDGFALFHLYVCAAFLLHWREQLMQQNDFQGLLLLLQNLPTHNWSDRQINVLVAEAFRLKFTYADAPKHLETKS